MAFSVIPSIVYLLAILAFLLNSYGSDTTSQRLLMIGSDWLGLIALTGLLILRFKEKFSLNSLIANLNKVLALLGISIGSLLSIYDYYTPINFVFAATRLQYIPIFMLGWFCLVVWFMTKPNKWLLRHHKKITFFASLAFFYIFWIISLWPFNIFKVWSHEDNLIENAQVVVLLGGAWFSYKMTRYWWSKRQTFHKISFALATVFLLFVAAEEISWGQRIFNVETPDQIAEINLQDEITVHNMEGVHHLVQIGYIFFGLYGSIMWIFQMLLRPLQSKFMSFYIPDWSTTGFYFGGFAYNFHSRYWSNAYAFWAEYMEFMIYSAVALTMLHFYLRIRNSTSKSW